MDLNDQDEESVQRCATTSEAKELLEKEAALKRRLVLMARQSVRVANRPKDKANETRQTWTQLFIDSRFGMNLVKPTGPRLQERHKAFKMELFDVMDARHPDPKTHNQGWCPVTRQYCIVQAGHLFAAKAGDDLMKEIFGEAEQDMMIGQPERGKSELFRACNGILWSQDVEKLYTKGLFTIVPDLDDIPSAAQAEAWQRSEPKEYRIRVLRPDHDDMQELRPNSDIRWVEMDSQRLQWRTTWRPRARYLYWAYCESILRQAYDLKSPINETDLRRQEVSKKYWGTAGPYMRKNMLLGFVEEMGHEYEHLLEGAMDASEDGDAGHEPAQVGVMTANEHILASIRSVDEEEDDNEGDDDDDDDDV